MESIDIAVDALTAEELDAQRGIAALDGDPDRLHVLDAEVDRRRRQTEHDALAAAERQRRQHVADVAEATAQLETFTAQLADLEQQHRDDLAALETTPQASASAVCERAYVSGRLAYSLAHDLFGITGDRRFYRPYVVLDQLALCGGAAGEAYVWSIRGRPPRLEVPWRDALERLKVLMGPIPTRIQNGG